MLTVLPELHVETSFADNTLPKTVNHAKLVPNWKKLGKKLVF